MWGDAAKRTVHVRTLVCVTALATMVAELDELLGIVLLSEGQNAWCLRVHV